QSAIFFVTVVVLPGRFGSSISSVSIRFICIRRKSGKVKRCKMYRPVLNGSGIFQKTRSSPLLLTTAYLSLNLSIERSYSYFVFFGRRAGVWRALSSLMTSALWRTPPDDVVPIPLAGGFSDMVHAPVIPIPGTKGRREARPLQPTPMILLSLSIETHPRK